MIVLEKAGYQRVVHTASPRYNNAASHNIHVLAAFLTLNKASSQLNLYLR
ncbi:hypothetical protein SAMN05216325_11730 [Nitrosomonas marina]|uniref:Uncharacterized protein n=1 Tax=Nitrosomonas marina TaxID=917 RepID=A0A1H8GAX7_9PROT|nr:hypothetical protein SAMN05216325_11730 [Nitrosomonas marina]